MVRPDDRERVFVCSEKSAFLRHAAIASLGVVLAPLLVVSLWRYLPTLALVVVWFGVLNVVVAGKCFLRWRLFGESTLELTPSPAALGGSLSGTISVGEFPLPEAGFEMRLTSVHTTGRAERERLRVLWQCTRILPRVSVRYEGGRIVLPFSFRIDADAEPTREEGRNEAVYWRLDVRADHRILDYEARFEVPVSEAEPTRPEHGAPHMLEPDYRKIARRYGVVLKEAPSSLRIRIPIGRDWMPSLFWLPLLAFWSELAVLAFVLGAPLLLVAVPTLFAVMSVVVAVYTLFYRSVVEARPHELSFRTGLFGMGKRGRLEAAAVADVTPVQHSSNPFVFGVRLTTVENESSTVAPGVGDLETVQSLCEEIQSILSS